MNPEILILCILFIFTSLIYAVSGQGGASAYLAILAIFGISYTQLPPISLTCNIIATIGIFYHFRKAGHLRWDIVLPFIIFSVPAAFIGGLIQIGELTFKIILILILTTISIRILFFEREVKNVISPSTTKKIIYSFIIGSALGLIAGIIGIGGGILLMPAVIFLRWGNTKEAALSGGLFTLVNSVSGLIAHGISGDIKNTLIIPLALSVLIGSQIGAHIGAKKISEKAIQKLFSILLLIVAIRLILGITNVI